ncbi:MAG: hypothetical protein ACJ8IQ_02105 [Chthoniobacterales bacterium]
MRHFLLLGCFLALAVAGCNKSKSPVTETKPRDTATKASETASSSTPAEPAPHLPDACTLVTSDEVKSVLGEAVQQTKPSTNTATSLATAQCYFALPTAANSMVLTVMKRGGVQAMHEWWKETFESEHPEREGEREEGEKKAKPEKVDGIGEGGYWTATKIGGALYVLQADTCLRISVGGKDDLPTKLKKSRALAELALKRL